MAKQRLYKGLFIAIILGILFFFMNWMNHPSSLLQLELKSLLLSVTFFLLYGVVFTLLSTEKRKMQYGLPIIISVITGMLIGIVFDMAIVGVSVGLLVGLAIGYLRDINKGV
ncbi:hypothetical protein [Staphylococcus felis]|uniref:hypothetical protein n=1 Tax=Staphylococcus felis TaxID=46127 RepID=UPI000E24564A|nr:hypothetical protein [Staphylococcus felis]REI33950.1 hypothetical protein DOS82_04545 [Staphylococcus felis]